MDCRSHREQAEHPFREAGLLHDCVFCEHKPVRTAVQSYRARRCFHCTARLRESRKTLESELPDTGKLFLTFIGERGGASVSVVTTCADYLRNSTLRIAKVEKLNEPELSPCI